MKNQGAAKELLDASTDPWPEGLLIAARADATTSLKGMDVPNREADHPLHPLISSRRWRVIEHEEVGQALLMAS